jgi:hypothetical protein
VRVLPRLALAIAREEEQGPVFVEVVKVDEFVNIGFACLLERDVLLKVVTAVGLHVFLVQGSS